MSTTTKKKCSYCGRQLTTATGSMLIKNDASILYFCSHKCRKNMMKLGRDPRKFKWTKNYVKGGIKARG